MGYSNEQSQLMTVPPYVVGCVATIAGGYLADRSKKRGVYMNFFCVIAIIGFLLVFTTTSPHVQYAGTFFVVSGYVLLRPFQVS
jgi:nitrate/nitrite transporter NarK